MKRQVSIKSDKSILVREVFRLKRELVAETHRADENLRALKELWGRYDGLTEEFAVAAFGYLDKDKERVCSIEGMGCEHIPGNDECVGCGNWQLVEHDELV